MALKDLKPVAGETRGAILGALLSVLLHLVAFVAIMAVGTAIDGNEGALLVLPFLVSIGLSQWIYIGPAAWLLRQRSTGMAKGLVISGGLVTFASTLCYGGVGLMSLQNASETRRIQQEERDHPHDYISTKGVITSVDDSHFEFKRDDDGTVVSLRTFQGLDYVFLKKDGGYENRTRDILKPGVRVSVEYSQERGKPPDSASIVRVYEEGAP
ncbi:MAG TPA: hypothetical protein VF456_02380 [Vicinamibacterales bacterium]